ncbi:MAG: ribosomal-processing cysteine protease Prp [Acutalibacteraceae bacterium]|nr:ribosomal-processing cysteine protease Prp [Clostridia bacterium]MEE1144999.1 ribosomal-processing cysteine protease Prp [Acutalibacteraceae bacterium]
MINVVFYLKNDNLSGFELSGHATVNEYDENGRLVCAYVSSSAIMTANTVSEIICDKADIQCDDGYLKMICQDLSRCEDILQGFRLHITETQKEYPEIIKISTHKE